MGVDLMENELEIKIGNCTRILPLISGNIVSYYSFNMLGDVELNREAAKLLSSKIMSGVDSIVSIESKAIALTQCVCDELKHSRYVIIRKTRKNYMKDILCVTGNTIISGENNYYIDGEDIKFLKGKKVVVLDDVISTCGTIDAIDRLLNIAGVEIVQFACVLCEGTNTISFKGKPVVSCGFIPLLETKNDR